MSSERRSWIIGITMSIPTVFSLGAWSVRRPTPPASDLPIVAPHTTQNQPDAKAIADFLELVKQYVALHQKHESALPHLPKEATPEQIDQRQRGLAALIQTARAGARRGDLFTPAMTAFIRQVLRGVFAGPEGKKLRTEILDEYPGGVTIKVNDRYPDVVPLANMPVAVLEALPKLPEELEYRFVGEHLILLDPHAHLIVDYIFDALPGR